MDHFHQDGSRILVEKQARALRDGNGDFAGGVEILKPVKGRTKKEMNPVDFHGILTVDPSFTSFLTELRQFALSDVNILIRGETGSGKEMVAQAIHKMSRRAGKPFVAVNCGALSRELVVSEIFGHKRGSFTGAVSDKKGLLAEAEGGTLFLDEVAELGLDIQVLLLRVLQEHRYRPLGSTRDLETDVRILSATHVSLRQAVKEKKFREDLMYRLRVLPLFVPPLRDRMPDIAVLWQHFTERAAEKQGVPVMQASPDLIAILQSYGWPGNVREMVNLAEFMVVTRSGKLALPEHLPPEFHEVTAAPSTRSKKRKLTAMPEAEKVSRALDEANGSIGDAAESLGVSRATFWRWRQKLGI